MCFQDIFCFLDDKLCEVEVGHIPGLWVETFTKGAVGSERELNILVGTVSLARKTVRFADSKTI